MPIDEWPNDAELHRLFRETEAPPSTIDAAAIIRRSKRRRLPQQVGVGSAVTLAVAGISVASINGIRVPSIMDAAETSSDTLSGESWEAADGAVPWSTRATACATPVPAAEASQSAFRVTAEFADGRAGDSIVGSVLLTNSSTEEFTGWVTAPIVQVTADGVVVAHNDVATSAMRIELAPGESRSLVASVDTVHCGHGGASAGAPLEPGEYDVVATVSITSETGGQPTTSGDFGGPAAISTEPSRVRLD